MSFTEEERRAWHADRKRRERPAESVSQHTPIAVCLHCQNPFGVNQGVVTEDAAICDVCNGD